MPELNLASVDLNLLVVFDAVMTERSVSRAADHLNLTQSGVSRAISRLRVMLADPLFVKAQGGVLPTTFAEAIAPEVSEALEQMRRALNPSGRFDPAVSDQMVRIGTPDYIGSALLPRLIAMARTEAPRLRFVGLQASSDVSVAMIDRGDIDLFVGRTSPQARRSVSSSHLYNERNVCVGRRDHPALKGPLSAQTFLAQEHLHISPSGGVGYIDDALARQGVARNIRHIVAPFLLVPNILQESDMICVAPFLVAEHWTRRYGLTLQDCPFDLGKHEIVQMWHQRLDRDPLLVWLRDKVAGILNRADQGLEAPAA